MLLDVATERQEMISACEIVSKYSSRISGDGKVFVVPDMDEQRLSKAVGYYAPLAEGEEALALLDTSIFSGAQAGIVVTDRHVFLRCDWSLPWRFALERIDTVAFVSKEEDKGGLIHINGVAERDNEGKDALHALAQMICELASAAQSREITLLRDRPKDKQAKEDNEHPDLARHRTLIRCGYTKFAIGLVVVLSIIAGVCAFASHGQSAASEKCRTALGLTWKDIRDQDTMVGYYRFILDLDARRIPPEGDRKWWFIAPLSSVYDEHKSKAEQRIAEIARTDHTKFAKLLQRLQYWEEAEQVVEILTAIKWQPATPEQRVHWEVARRQGDYLERNWEESKAVLLADLATEEYEPIRNALYVFISMGRDDAVPELEETLRTKGGKVLAEAYLNCGHPQLAETAKRWARKHGYEVSRTGGSAPVAWGQWK